MALVANLQERQEKLERIWQWIVDYVNGDGTIRQFESLAVHCLSRLGVEEAPEMLRQCEDVKSGKSLRELADDYRGPLRDALHWIISPKVFPMMQAEEFIAASLSDRDAANFLMDHARGLHITLEPGLTLNRHREDATIRLRRVFAGAGSVVAGICRFMLDQVDRHELEGVPLAEAFPFGLCEREGCGRFYFVQRIGRGKFCSDKCRATVAKSRQPREDKAAYMREFRARKAKERKKAKIAERQAAIPKTRRLY